MSDWLERYPDGDVAGLLTDRLAAARTGVSDGGVQSEDFARAGGCAHALGLDPLMKVSELHALGKAWADDRHLIRFTNDGWTIQHPLRERIDGTLFDCEVRWTWGHEGFMGVWEIGYDEDGYEILLPCDP